MKLKISPELSLPLDAVTQKLAAIGRTGSGKSYFASKLAEEMLTADAQIVVLDVVGVWWGLRLDGDGKSPGLSIPVFGGLHGDIPLEPTAGKLLADLIVDKGISVVLDLSQFEADSDKTRFATDFGDRFFFRKKSAPSAIHVFLEECQEIIPQNIQRGEERMLHSWQRLIRLGRNFGIGATLITQRPQDVNKKALNQAECVFAFQLTGPQERKAIDLWMSDKGLDLDLASDLPKLSIGEAHVWSPAWLKISETVKIGKKRTFNASGTPEVGRRAKSHDLAKIDLESLHEQMKATIEKSKASDPAELKKRISELEKQLKSVPKERMEVKTKEVAVLKDKQVARMEKLFVTLENRAQQHGNAQKLFWDHFEQEAKALLGALRQVSNSKAEIRKPVFEKTITKAVVNPSAKNNSGNTSLPIGEEKILSALIQFDSGLLRNQLTVLAGYKRSSRDAYIARLTQKGLVESNGNGKLIATKKGIEALPNYTPLPVGEELQEYWMNNLPQGEKLILAELIKSYPQAIARNDLDGTTGFKRSSRDAYLARLSAKELVVIESSGFVKASENLF